ncbi:LrgB family protein [Virgibacillus alimentarius]|uniref:Murein hydrolase (TIGR00659 family) n=1 Tax=Virgibacillus alimentarius TaxID=698769 RepID=A0ABS4SAN8_9BACI|nr:MULTISPECIES: LrgB family protein [Virgibacillus]MBP2258407.1 putative murein hydrolase (TIGR00659 family) [Virgibacillus alimentarius]HLR67664.1 LrgB family protein [Virgibacillus sp.]
MINFFIGLLAILSTVGIYMLAKKINEKVPSPFTLPILIATIIIILLLLLFHIPYDTYMIGGEWLNQLLGPAVVALAYPLYVQRNIIKQIAMPIFIGVLIGAFVGISTGVLFAKWAGFGELIIYSLSPKSVTTPVAMDIADTLGGAPPLAVIFVMIAGIGGSVLSSVIFKWSRITNYMGRGVGIGSASHAIGTAKAMENSQLEGSISTVAMVLSAIFVSILTPVLVSFWI